MRATQTETYSEDGAFTRVQDPHQLVFAGREDLRAVSVPTGAVNEVRVNSVDPHHGLAPCHVPKDNHVIAA